MKSKKERGPPHTGRSAHPEGPGAPADTLPYNEVLRQLLVHQIAIEMQNEELRRAQDIIEESRTRYVDLYDFAPVAYLTFDETGRVMRRTSLLRLLDRQAQPYRQVLFPFRHPGRW